MPRRKGGPFGLVKDFSAVKDILDLGVELNTPAGKAMVQMLPDAEEKL